MELIRAGDELLGVKDAAQQLVGQCGGYRHALSDVLVDQPHQANQIYEVESGLEVLGGVAADIDQMVADVYEKFFRDVTAQSYRLYGELMAEELTGRVSSLADRFLTAKSHVVNDITILHNLIHDDEDKQYVADMLHVITDDDLMLMLYTVDPVEADFENSVLADE